MSDIEEMALELARNYQREWRARNKDKVAAKNRRYWMKKAREHIAKQLNAEKKERENAETDF